MQRTAGAGGGARCRHRTVGRRAAACAWRVLSLARFKQILRLDPVARLAVVQPGCATWRSRRRPPATVSTTRRIPPSQIVCTIGGNVAENSGGVHCLKYGLTVHNVLRVRGLTMAGEVVEFGSHASMRRATICWRWCMAPRDAGGGHRGQRQAHPPPQLAQCVMASFDDVVTAGNAVAAVIAAGIIPPALK